MEAALSVYYACVESRLRYGAIFWANSVEVDRIFRIQKACIRAVYGLNARDTCRPIFKHNKILTVASIYVLECALFVKVNYDEFFKKYELHHYCNTRGTAHHYLLPPKTHLSKIQSTCMYQCIKIYNHLPEKLKTQNLIRFKSILKSFLTKNVPYSIKEFLNTQVVLDIS